MRGAVMYAPRDVRVEDVPEPHRSELLRDKTAAVGGAP